MSWLLQLLATGPSLARLHSFFLSPLCIFPSVSLSSFLPLSGLILSPCASLLSVLLPVCQMMYSRCSSSMALVGPWRILKLSPSSPFLSPSQTHKGWSVGSGSVCVAVDVAVFEVCSWDQTVALLNNPLTQPSIFTSLSLFFFFSFCFPASPQQGCSISHLLESSPAHRVLLVTMMNCFLPNGEQRKSLAHDNVDLWFNDIKWF